MNPLNTTYVAKEFDSVAKNKLVNNTKIAKQKKQKQGKILSTQ